MQYHCCGSENYTNWFSLKAQVPDSCCITETKDCAAGINVDTPNADKVIYTDGCYDSLQQSALNNLAAITAGAVVLALVQVM